MTKSQPTRPRRLGKVSRKTAETEVTVEIDLDGDGQVQLNSGLAFLDHMLHALAKHARMNLKLECKGDLAVDDHHTAEDCALCLGEAMDIALGDRRGIRRFAHAYAPLDEALARAVIDLSGRPSHHIDLGLRREKLGDIATENLVHFMQSLAVTLRATLHVDVLRGDNDHHRVEAAFKALALALRQAIEVDGDAIPSTKEKLGQ